MLLSPGLHAPGNYNPPSPANLPTLHRGGNKRLEAGHGGNKRLEAGHLRGNVVRWRVAPVAPHSSSHGVERHVCMTVAAAKTFTGHPPARARLASGRGRRARPGRAAAVDGCDSWTAKYFFYGQRGAVGEGGGRRGGRDDRGRGRRDGGGWRIIDGDVRGCHIGAVLTASHRPRCGPTGPTGSDSFREVWICRRRCACSVILHTINTRGVLMRPDVAHGTNLSALGLHGKQKVQRTPRLSLKSACFFKWRSTVAPHQIVRISGPLEAAKAVTVCGGTKPNASVLNPGPQRLAQWPMRVVPLWAWLAVEGKFDRVSNRSSPRRSPLRV